MATSKAAKHEVKVFLTNDEHRKVRLAAALSQKSMVKYCTEVVCQDSDRLVGEDALTARSGRNASKSTE